MEARAILKNCPMSPRKMRMVADQVRGKKIEDALNILKFNQRPVYAEPVEKLLLSAISNWNQQNDGSGNTEDLVVKSIFVNPGPAMKRIQPAPQGRAHRIRKRSNHITLIVADNQLDAMDMEVETEELDTEN